MSKLIIYCGDWERSLKDCRGKGYGFHNPMTYSDRSDDTERDMIQWGYCIMTRFLRRKNQDETIPYFLNSALVFGGVRLAVKHGLISHEDIQINYFPKKGPVVHPTILPEGKVSNWPKGFFDGFDFLLDLLLDPANTPLPEDKGWD